MAGQSSTETFVYVLGAGGLGAIVTAIIAAVSSKRKLGAEATKIITDAAAGVVTTLQAENKRQRDLADQRDAEHRAAIRTLLINHAEEIDQYRRVLQLHIAWDYIAIDRLKTVGIVLPEPPPLTPAHRFPKLDPNDDGGTLDS